jgi:hypothetical protein
MKVKDSIKQFAQRVVDESIVDIDINFCKENGIKYKNHEKDASKVELFTSESNLAAYKAVFKKK